MNATQRDAITKAIFGVEEALEACDACYNLTCGSDLKNIYDIKENCYKFCDDCFDKESTVYIKTGVCGSVAEHGAYYFQPQVGDEYND